jgi:hypothetical protein
VLPLEIGIENFFTLSIATIGVIVKPRNRIIIPITTDYWILNLTSKSGIIDEIHITTDHNLFLFKIKVDGKELEEPYVQYPCQWNLSPRRVEKDCVYVIGDNRGMPIENHHFGQTSKGRIMGTPLW